MKDFFEEYLAIPLGILLMIFIAPTVVLGGATFAAHVFGVLPEMGICQKVKK
jgi:hypothetical protein